MLDPLQPPNFDYALDKNSGHEHKQHKAVRLSVPTPPMGSKIVCIKEHGIWVLEEGPTLWRGMMCTHPGSGGYTVYDGVPDCNGFFTQSAEWYEESKALAEREAQLHESIAISENSAELQRELNEILIKQIEHYNNRNGREVAFANPAVMGMWMFDAGMIHGLTIMCLAEHSSSAPIISITWQPQKKKH